MTNLKKPISPVVPSTVSVNFVSDEDEYDYAQIGKSTVHAVVVPFVLTFLNPQIASAYLLFATTMYATLFRAKSKEYFSILAFVFAIYFLLVIS